MTTTTSNLGLFKYDTSSDRNLAFNIDKALNQNWDKLDTGVALKNHTHSDYQSTLVSGTNIKTINGNSVLGSGNIEIASNYLIDSQHNGKNWYRIYLDGWKEQGGLIFASATEVDWESPSNLTSNYNESIGGNNFAIDSSQTTTGMSNGPVWQAFDGKPATQFNTNQGESSYLKWYNPTAIKVTSINITNYANTSYAFGRVIVQGSNDDVSYTDIKEYTNSNNIKGDTWTISMSNNTNFYKYYKMLLLTSAQSSNTYRNCGDIKIYGKMKVEGSSNSIVFPLSFNNTNYNFNFGFQDSSGINIYILSKLKTGFSLSGSSSSTISWLACGY